MRAHLNKLRTKSEFAMIQKVVLFIAMLLSVGVVSGQEKFVPNKTTYVPDGSAADLIVAPPEGAGVLLKVYPQPSWKAPNTPNRAIFLGEKGVKYTVDVSYFRYNEEKKVVEVTGDTQYLFFGKEGEEPEKKEPDPKKPDDVIPPPTLKSFYFLIVRPDGPASPSFTENMKLKAWADLKARGHQVKDVTASEAATLKIVASSPPSVFTLTVANNKSTIYRGEVPLPSLEADILKLAEGGK